MSNTVGGTRAIASAMTELKLSVSNNVVSVGTGDVDVSVVTMGLRNSSLAANDTGTGAVIEFGNAQIEQDVKVTKGFRFLNAKFDVLFW